MGSYRAASLARNKGSAQRLRHCSIEIATGGIVADPLGACSRWRQQHGAEEPSGSLGICLSLRRRLVLLPLGIGLCGYWTVAVRQALRGVRAQRKGYGTAASRSPPTVWWWTRLVLAPRGAATRRRGAWGLSCPLPRPQTKARSSLSWHRAVRLLGTSCVAGLARSKGSAQSLQHCSFEVATGGMGVDPLGACARWRQQHDAEEPGGSLTFCLSLRRRLALLPLGMGLSGYWTVAVRQALRGVRAQRKVSAPPL